MIDEGALPVDLDDGQPLAVAPLELGVAGDVHLVELERHLVARCGHDAARPLAQVAAGRVVEDDPAGYG